MTPVTTFPQIIRVIYGKVVNMTLGTNGTLFNDILYWTRTDRIDRIVLPLCHLSNVQDSKLAFQLGSTVTLLFRCHGALKSWLEIRPTSSTVYDITIHPTVTLLLSEKHNRRHNINMSSDEYVDSVFLHVGPSLRLIERLNRRSDPK